MNTDDTSQSPFTKPRFIIAAIVMAFIVIFGIAIVFINAAKDDPDLASHESTESSSTTSPPAGTEPVGGASICGLKGVVLEGTLPKAPETQWEYQGTTAYPVSAKYGPGAVSDEGYRYCFQHSPEGALFTAANAVVQATDPSTIGNWLNYFIASGPYRDALLNQEAPGTPNTGTRVEIAGFRFLSYTGEAAKVDIGIKGSTAGQTVTLSMVYALTWEDGDWKLIVSDPNSPIDVANIPNLSGYTVWGE